jgi:hypothetical protein
MATEKLKLKVTYNPNLDTLYLSTPLCTGRWMDSRDGMFFFMVYNETTDTVPTGFEIHHLADVWNDEEIIPSLDLRFEIEGTDLQDVTLKEVLRWAYEQFVVKREEGEQIEYTLSATQPQVAIREKREDE